MSVSLALTPYINTSTEYPRYDAIRYDTIQFSEWVLAYYDGNALFQIKMFNAVNCFFFSVAAAAQHQVGTTSTHRVSAVCVHTK